MNSKKRIVMLLLLVLMLFCADLAFAQTDDTPEDDAAIPVESITFSTNSKMLAKDKRWFLSVTVNPQTADNPALEWIITDSSVATIIDATQEGVWIHTTGAPGSRTRIIARATDGSDVQARCIISVTAPVEDIIMWTVNDQDTLIVNESVRLLASVLPSDASNELIWTVSDESRALLSQPSSNGVTITGISGGNVRVTARSQDGSSYYKSFEIFVRVPVDSVYLPESANVFISSTIKLKPGLSPADTTDTTIRWRSSNESVATVDEKGVVTGIGTGQARIRAVSSANSSVYGECLVTVTRPILLLNLTTAHPVIGTGGSTQIIATIAPYNATNKYINWTVSDTSVATVDSIGIVTGLKAGTVIVTAHSLDGSRVMGVLPIEVRDALESISLPAEKSLYPGQSTKLALTASPHGIKVDGVFWSSSDPSVVEVSDDGVITAIAQGKATIAAAAGNAINATCEVTVSEVISDVRVFAPDEMEIYNNSVYEMYIGDSFELSAQTQPITSFCTIKWRSANPGIAAINSEGVLNAKSSGTARITVSAIDPNTARTIASKSFRVNVTKPITSVTLPEETIVLLSRQTKLTPVIKPSSAADKVLAWASSNDSVASVENGVVTGNSIGRAMITATSSNLIVGITNVTVVQPVESIELTLPEHISKIKAGDSFNISANVFPETASQKVSWKSSNAAVAKVDAHGKVTTRKGGQVTITASAIDGSGVKDSIKLNISVAVNGINIKKTITELFLGGGDDFSSTLIKPQITPQSATDYIINWYSSDMSVATVEDGLIRAVAEGVCTVTAEAEGNRDSIIVSVMRLPSYISLPFESLSINVGDKVSVATDLSFDGSDTYIKWKTSRKGVATINKDGLIKAKKAGRTIITAVTRNGHKASFMLTVTK
ncbi:MAG: Ig-like domain-containing protein [Clostridia bacterium]|nr:Ig-like domain-containing protein [Clostridia bacterium]